MGTRIAHRGPDSSGVFIDADTQIALVHQRLSIIDLSPAGSQPMADGSDRFVICYNGEVYNFPELRAELEQGGHVFRGRSDTEVVLELFARDGVACLSRLNGIFALAVWDRRDRVLTLARDGLGVKPLYVTRTPSGLAFSSEMKAFLALEDLDRTIDPGAVAAYLSFLWSPGERTMFRSVRKLQPGSWLTVQADGTEQTGRFYTLPRPVPRTDMSDADWIARLTTQFDAAVARQMVTDVEVGSFLSGGLDSSAIVASALQHVGPRGIQCFTIDYQEKPSEAPEILSDLPYAKEVANYLGVDLHQVSVSSEISAGLADLAYILDEPLADLAAMNNLLISALARQHGIKVLLSGTGGDDLFSGYRRHVAAQFDGVWDKVPGVARNAISGLSRTLLPPTGKTRRLRKVLEPVSASAQDRTIAYFEWLNAERVRSLITPSLSPPTSEIRAPFYRTLADLGPADAFDRVLWLDQHHFLADHNLTYTDKTGMAHGVEIRVPFLDYELVALAAQMPRNIKIRDGKTKWVLREAMKPRLPSNVMTRKKAGFGLPLRSWLKNELRALADDLLSPETITRRGLFDFAQVQRLREDTLSDREDGSYTLLSLMMIELWCRSFADSQLGCAAQQSAA
jgi:asparagine synthase (glutamine-hydrolysing)